MHNPFVDSWPLSQSWEEHIRTAGPDGGAEDYALPSGISMEACSSGTISHNVTVRAGLSIFITRPDGSSTQHSHCLRQLVPDGTWVEEYDLGWGLSGNSGTPTWGGSYGSHVHVVDWTADGQRRRPFTTGTSTAGGGGTPINPTVRVKAHASKEKEMIAVTIIDGKGSFGPVNKQRTYIVGGSIFVDTTDHPTAYDTRLLVNGYGLNDNGSPFIPKMPNLSYRELYDWAKASKALTDTELAPYKAAAGL